MSTPYNADYVPPVPVVEVSFSVPGQTITAGPFAAVVDTGADATVAPKTMLLSLGAPSLFDAQLRSPWGESHPVIIYLVDLQLASIRLPGVQVAADETAQEITLGRNVLNKLALFLDGPEQLTDILDGAAVQRLRARHAPG